MTLEQKMATIRNYRRLAYAVIQKTYRDAYGKNVSIRIQEDALDCMKSEWYEDLWEFSNARLSQELIDIKERANASKRAHKPITKTN